MADREVITYLDNRVKALEQQIKDCELEVKRCVQLSVVNSRGPGGAVVIVVALVTCWTQERGGWRREAECVEPQGPLAERHGSTAYCGER